MKIHIEREKFDLLVFRLVLNGSIPNFTFITVLVRLSPVVAVQRCRCLLLSCRVVVCILDVQRSLRRVDVVLLSLAVFPSERVHSNLLPHLFASAVWQTPLTFIMALEIFPHTFFMAQKLNRLWGGFQVFSILDFPKAKLRVTSGNVHMAMVERSLSGRIHLEESND